MSLLEQTLRAALPEAIALAAVAAVCALALARRPAPSDRLLTLRPRPWFRWMVGGLAVLVAAGAGTAVWVSLQPEGVPTSFALATAAVRLGVAGVLLLLLSSATLVAARDGLHWLGFRLPWDRLVCLETGETGVRFRVRGRPRFVAVRTLVYDLWPVTEGHVRRLRAIRRRETAGGEEPAGGGAPARLPELDPADVGVVRKPVVREGRRARARASGSPRSASPRARR